MYTTQQTKLKGPIFSYNPLSGGGFPRIPLPRTRPSNLHNGQVVVRCYTQSLHADLCLHCSQTNVLGTFSFQHSRHLSNTLSSARFPHLRIRFTKLEIMVTNLSLFSMYHVIKILYLQWLINIEIRCAPFLDHPSHSGDSLYMLVSVKWWTFYRFYIYLKTFETKGDNFPHRQSSSNFNLKQPHKCIQKSTSW